jgi:hypothetical protein
MLQYMEYDPSYDERVDFFYTSMFRIKEQSRPYSIKNYTPALLPISEDIIPVEERLYSSVREEGEDFWSGFLVIHGKCGYSIYKSFKKYTPKLQAIEESAFDDDCDKLREADYVSMVDVTYRTDTKDTNGQAADMDINASPDREWRRATMVKARTAVSLAGQELRKMMMFETKATLVLASTILSSLGP